jgi:hypothetical protein
MGLFNRNQAAAARPGMPGMPSMGQVDMAAMIAERDRAMNVVHNGIVGQGTIISMRDSGVTVSGDPEVEFEVAVQLPDRPAYRVTHRQVVHHLMKDQFQVGAGVPVRVDPQDPNSIVIA